MLCFKCDEKQSFNHIRKNKELRLVLVDDDEEVDNKEIVEKEEPHTKTEDPMAGISLQSLI